MFFFKDGLNIWPSRLGCRIHWLHFYSGVNSFNKFPGYDTKQSDDKASVILEFWEMLSIPSIPLLPGPLWLRVKYLKRPYLWIK